MNPLFESDLPQHPIRDLLPGPEAAHLETWSNRSLSGGEAELQASESGGCRKGRKDGGPGTFICSLVFGAEAFTMAGSTLLPSVRSAVCCLPTCEETATSLPRFAHPTRRR